MISKNDNLQINNKKIKNESFQSVSRSHIHPTSEDLRNEKMKQRLRKAGHWRSRGNNVTFNNHIWTKQAITLFVYFFTSQSIVSI